ncbi:MAG: copper-binding protein [Gammaproteobacteria bacterium]|nr:copper-binding protein [Gammaproteobacteria bacterium]
MFVTCAAGASPICAPAAPPAPAHYTVTITGFAFVPATLTVRSGDRVTWVNNDIVPHTATATDGSWDTGTIEANGEVEITIPEEAGEDYLCRFHRAMTARLQSS